MATIQERFKKFKESSQLVGAEQPTDIATRFQQFKASQPEIQPAILTTTEPVPEPVQEQPESLSAGQVATQAFKNIPESGGKFLQNIASAVTSPVETTEALTQAGVGGLQKLFGKPEAKTVTTPQGRTINVAGDDHTRSFEGIRDFAVQRYGGTEQAKRTIAKDPVGALADFSFLLTGGGAALSTAGKLGKLGKLTKAGQDIAKAGKALEPLGIIAKPAKAVTNFAGRKLGDVAGIVSGTGENIKLGLKAATAGGPQAESFIQGLRGVNKQKNIFTSSRDAMMKVKDKRALAYKQIATSLDDPAVTVNIQPIQNTLDDVLKEFKIKTTDKGTLDLSRSTLDRAAHTRVKQLVKDVRSWDDFTAGGIDTLKQRIDDLYIESNNAQVFVAKVRSSIKDLLDEEVPGYRKATADYEKITTSIKDIEKDLGLKIDSKGRMKGGKSPDGVVNRIVKGIDGDKEFRTELIDVLDVESGGKLKSQIAGAAFNPVFPRGLTGKVTSGMEVGLLLGLGNPKFWPVLGLSSPRAVGELLNALGKATRIESGIEKTGILGPLARQAAFQAGRGEVGANGPRIPEPESPPKDNRKPRLSEGLRRIGRIGP